MAHSLLLILCSFSILPAVSSRFNLPTCWGEGAAEWCVVRGANGTWCAHPSRSYVHPSTRTRRCDAQSAHNSPDFTLAMQAHLQQGRSIGYYSGVDNTFLGGFEYPIPANPGITRVCVSGIAADGSGVSMCGNAVEDNAWSMAGGYCVVQERPTKWLDGCFEEPVTTSTHVDLAPTRLSTGGPCETGCSGGSRSLASSGCLIACLPFLVGFAA